MIVHWLIDRGVIVWSRLVDRSDWSDAEISTDRQSQSREDRMTNDSKATQKGKMNEKRVEKRSQGNSERKDSKENPRITSQYLPSHDRGQKVTK